MASNGADSISRYSEFSSAGFFSVSSSGIMISMASLVHYPYHISCNMFMSRLRDQLLPSSKIGCGRAAKSVFQTFQNARSHSHFGALKIPDLTRPVTSWARLLPGAHGGGARIEQPITISRCVRALWLRGSGAVDTALDQVEFTVVK